MGIKGELDEYRSIIINHSCDGARRTFDIFRAYINGERVFFLDIPKKCDELAVEYFTHILELLKSYLEKASGLTIQNNKIMESIKSYNINREYLREVYDLRALYPHLFNAHFMTELLDANVRFPVGEMNRVLKSLIDDVKIRATDMDKSPAGKRIFVCGNIIDSLPMLNSVENAGGQVVGDDFCFGGRYFPQTVDEGSSPLESLSRRYLEKLPCGRMDTGVNRFDLIIDKMQNYGARGLIYTSLKFCDNYLLDYPSLKRHLDGKGIPSIFIESEYFPMGRGQIETRIEGFLEML